jgi:hypothetical protein
MNGRMGMGMGTGMLALCSGILMAQSPGLPAGFEPAARTALEHIIDSARVAGLPLAPLYAKAAEGKLKQAADAQIVAAVGSLASRFRAIRSELGSSLDVTSMTAAATAMSAGIPLTAIRDMRDAAAGSSSAAADLAGALVTATDLVAQRVSPASAVAAVQSLLARRALPERYARLRAEVGETVAAGRSPDQAARNATESIVKTLPPAPPTVTTTKPPLGGDGSDDAQVPLPTSTMRNRR